MTVRRMKTYAGGQGYVYQYYFVGERRASSSSGQEPAFEYIFDVTSDRKSIFAVSVFVSDHAVDSWAARHGRVLTDAERYAAVKMRLFRAFDEIEELKADGRTLKVDETALDSSLTKLGVD